MKAGVGRLVTLDDPRSAGAEAYRTLRANIQFSTLDRPLRTLLVTSAGADEGKAITLGNLAVVLAQAGSRVVAVDCDLRRPSLHEAFGLANEKGLTTALLDDTEGDLPLQPTIVPNLQVLAAGPTPPNPADLLATPRMQRVVERLVASSDLVLFNAPPAAFTADAAILASRLDGTLLVVSAGRTRREMAGRAKAVLERANARLLGVVVENVQLEPNLRRYYDSRGK